MCLWACLATTATAQGFVAPRGWRLDHDATLTHAPWGLAPQAAAAMAEFGLVRRQVGRYRHARQAAQLEVWLFGDSQGAYGAATYLRALRAPGREMARRQWLLRGEGAISARAWREWTRRVVGGTQGPLPLLRQHLPAAGLVPDSANYAEGPAGLAAIAPWLPAQAVNFPMEPVIAAGWYRLGREPAAQGQLIILSYPTPQIAAAQLAPIRSAAGLARRSGPFVVAWHGPASRQASKLLATVHYRAIVAWSQPIGLQSLPGLILAIFVLVGFILAVCLAAGLFAGGLRILLAKWFPRRFAAHADRLIRLKLQ